MTTTIKVRTTSTAWHAWPDAPTTRGYLASPHRHTFHTEVTAAVHHDERDIEFHDLLDVVNLYTPKGDMEGASCETMAKRILEQSDDHFPGRILAVEVWEDGECGARVER